MNLVTRLILVLSLPAMGKIHDPGIATGWENKIGRSEVSKFKFTGSKSRVSSWGGGDENVCCVDIHGPLYFYITEIPCQINTQGTTQPPYHDLLLPFAQK